MSDDASRGAAGNVTSSYREIRFEHSRSFAPLLAELGVSLVVSTYQAGKLAVLSASEGTLSLSFHNFDRPMGVAVRGHEMAVAARTQVWRLKNVPGLAAQLAPQGSYDACFLARSAQVTGEIQAHELSFAGDELWIVNTLFSCLCTLSADHSFVPRWRPPFVTRLAAEDRCHLNGLAVADGRPRYVTALAETDEPSGWRPNKTTSGCLIDVDSGATVCRGFAMPHSPRVHRGNVWLLDSGRGQVVRVDVARGIATTVTALPGYTRGLAIAGRYAFVGLSKIRETSTFGGVPIAEKRDDLKCGVGVVDIERGHLVSHFEFTAGVDEIFDVAVLPGVRRPAVRGPYSTEDGDATIWVVPEESKQ